MSCNNSQRIYVLSIPGLHKGHQFLENVFLGIAERIYGVADEDISRFKALNGGCISIDNKIIHFFGESVKFGKYDEQIVRPIAERWRDKNIPNHELIFE